MFSDIKFISAIDLAKYVVWYTDNQGVPITNLKLQKLLYYIQGAHLKKFGWVLFHDVIEAWDYGPVVRSVYIHYCGYGALNLRPNEGDEKLCDDISAESKQLIERVLDEKMHWTARKLIRTAVMEDPWKNHAEEVAKGERPIISMEEMALWFRGRL